MSVCRAGFSGSLKPSRYGRFGRNNGVHVNKKLWSVGVACVLAACGNQAQNHAVNNNGDSSSAPTAEATVNILYLQGDKDEAARQGVDLALAEVNEKAWKIQGQTVRFVLRSVEGRKEAALLSAIQSRQPAAALGDINPAQAVVLQQQNLPAVSLRAEPTEADGQTVFHINATARQQGSLIGQYLAVQQGLDKIAVVSHGQQTELTQALQDRVQTAGGHASMYILGKTNQADVRQLVLQLKTAQPDLIFYSGDAKSAAMLVRKLQQNKVLVPVMMTQEALGKSFIQQAAAYAPGSMAVMAGMPLTQLTGADRFGAAFAERFHTDPNEAAAAAYDGTWALLTAMKLADSTAPQTYASKLKTLNMSGGLLSGALTFDNQGQRNEAVLTVDQVEEGGWVVADSIRANPNQAQTTP